MKKQIRRAISIMLVLASLFTSLPSTTLYANAVVDDARVHIQELVEENDEYTRVFLNSDGTRTAYTYLEPIAFEDQDGEYTLYDNTIIESEQPGYLKNKASDVDVYLPDDISENAVIVKDDAYRLEMKPIASANGAKPDGHVRGKHHKRRSNEITGKPQLHGRSEVVNTSETKSLEYDVAPGVTLEYAPFGRGIKENIVLASRPDTNEFCYELKLTDLTPELDGDGVLNLLNAQQEIVFQMSAPFMYDAKDEYSEDIKLRVNPLDGAGRYTITVIPNEVFLATATYPVTIDPTIEKLSTDTGGLCGRIVSNSNYGPYPNTEIICTGNGNYAGTEYALIKFPHYNIPSGYQLDSAYLDVTTCNFVAYNAADVGAMRITRDWTSSVTWASYHRGTVGTSDTGVAVSTVKDVTQSGNKTLQWKVTDIAKAWYSGSSNYGIVLKSVNGKTGYREWSTHRGLSASYAPPKLTITYVPTLNVSPTSWTAPNAGGSCTFTVASGGVSWSVTSSDTSWLTVSTLNSTQFQATAKQNLGTSSRTGTITVRAGAESIPIKVTQSITQSYTIQYYANGDGAVIKPEPTSLDQIKYHGVDLKLSVGKPEWALHNFLYWSTSPTDASSGTRYNPGDIYKSNANLKLYAIWEQEWVTVNGDDSLLFDAVDAAGATFNVTVATNKPPWTLVNDNWITPSPLSGSSGVTLQLRVAQNSGIPRSGSVRLNVGTKGSATIQINQKGAPPPPNYVDIFWIAEGGTVPSASRLEMDKPFGNNLPKTEKYGYYFGGWWTERNGNGDEIISSTPTPKSESRYYAYWTIDFEESVICRNLYDLDCDGDPVNMVGGNFTWDYTDITVYGSDPLEFTRYYNSIHMNYDELGYGWRHNYMYSAAVNDTGTRAAISFPNGNRLACNIAGGKGSFIGPAGMTCTFEVIANGYLLTDQSFNKYSFDRNGYLISIEDMGGKTTAISRSGKRINSVSNSSGMLIFSYSGDKISKITARTGQTDRSISYAYLGDDLKSYTNTDGDTVDYTYDGLHHISLISDFNGKKYLQNTYDEEGRVAKQTLMGQGTSTFKYEDGISTIITPDGAVRKYYYDDDLNVTMVEDVNGQTKYEYEDGRLVSVTDRLGNTTTNTYSKEGSEFGYGDINDDGAIDSTDLDLLKSHIIGDSDVYPLAGRDYLAADVNLDGELNTLDALILAQYIDGNYGITLPYGVDSDSGGFVESTSAGNLIGTEYPDGTAEFYIYNDLNLVTRRANRDGTVELYDYDERGNQTSYTDARGNTTTSTYDSDNNLLTSTDVLGNTTSFSYDSNGNVLTEKDPLGNVTSYEYDVLGRLEKEKSPDGGEINYEYTSAGKLVKVTDADGNATTFTVNGNGFETGSTDPMGFSTSAVYNEQNQPFTVTDAEGNKTTYAYDSVGQMISTIDALGNTTSYQYDLAGQMTSMTDSCGNTWECNYDAEGRMTAISDPLGNMSSIVYDDIERTLAETDARGATTLYEYDAMGRVTKTTDAMGYSTRSVYDKNGNEIEQYDSHGNKWSYVYDLNDRMIEAIDPLGFKTTFIYDANGQQTKTVSALGAQEQSVYDNMGRLASSIDAEGNETKYEYDILGRLVKTVYADGTFSTSEYNANGWLVSATSQDGGVTSYTYNKNGQVLAITDALGGETSYEYDALGRTVSVTDAMGGVTKSEYDENGNLEATTDAMGGVTSYIYDAAYRVTEIKDAMGSVTKTEYDENGNVGKIINPDGGVITYEYDILDRLISTTDAEGYTVTYTYDANGNTLETVDGRGNSTTTEYDALNRAVKQGDESGNFTNTEYDADGRVIVFINAEGAETIYEYDLNGNVTNVTDALGNETHTTYDSMGCVVTMTDARGAVTTYTYTVSGQVKTITDALGGVKSYEYDLLGNLKKETNELGKTTTYIYDALSRPVTVTNSLGDSEHFEYDATGRIGKVTDKNGNQTRYVYDWNGNVIRTIDALGNSSYFEYDAMNQLIKVRLYRIDERHNVNEEQITLYEYDKRGLLTKEINAAGDSTIYVYDGNGNMIQKTDADGIVTEFGYDSRNLVEAINYSDGKSVQFAYNRNGELVTMTDWNGTVDYTLDELDRIKSVNDRNGKVTRYTYDATDNKTSMTYPDGTVAEYTYDLLGRLTNLNDAENQNTVYGYDAASQLIAMAYPNGWKESYEYDVAGQLVKQLAKDPANRESSRSYSYDPQGNISSETRFNTDGRLEYSSGHDYDQLNRLINTDEQFHKGDGNTDYSSRSYSYDSIGNLIYENGVSGDLNDWLDWTYTNAEYWYNNLNQQTRKLADGVNTYYTFDKRGNLVKAVGASNAVVAEYVYDATNRMVKGVNDRGEQSAYIFSGQGDLIGSETTIAGVTVKKDYALDYISLLKNVIMESVDNGLSYRYTYGLQKTSMAVSGADSVDDKMYYHFDRLGSIVCLTNDAGTVTSYVAYDEWGVPTAGDMAVAEYTGHMWDQVLGLYYARARMYDPAGRRFAAVDPAGSDIAQTQTFNLYVYALNNPLAYIDLQGLAPTLVSGGMITINTTKKTINNVYLDGTKVYTDFYEALKAYGANLSYGYENGVLQTYVFSPGKTRRSKIVGSGYDGKPIKIYTYEKDNSGYYRKYIGSRILSVTRKAGQGVLVDFEYFKKFMCDTYRNYGSTFNDALIKQIEQNKLNAKIDNFVKIAMAEKGYHEKNDDKNLESNNSKYDGNKNYTKYNKWFVNKIKNGKTDQDIAKKDADGFMTANWCHTFVSWVAERAGMSSYVPCVALCSVGEKWFGNKNAFKKQGTYKPYKGDIIYYKRSGGGHVGIVVAYTESNNKVYSIEGNKSDQVMLIKNTRDASINGLTVTGYGVLGGNNRGKAPSGASSGGGTNT